MKKFFPHLEKNFSELLEACRGRNIAVVGHMRPDGDCVGSQFALADILASAGAKKTVCLNQNGLPRLYENFAYGREFLSAEDFDDPSFDIVTVDCADYARTNLKLRERYPSPLGCIDHHVTNNTVAKINAIDPSASATAEIIAGMAFDAGIKISPDTANRLYMSIATDTRQFTTSSTRALTFEIAARLVESGADSARVAMELYQRETIGKLRLLCRFLDTLKLYENGRICVGVLENGVFAQTGSEKADSDGLVDYARSIDGVQIALLLEQMPNGVKGSLRAKTPDLRVNEIAESFGGGGHFAAAGFTAEGRTIADFYEQILSTVKKHLQKFDSIKS